MNYEFHRSIAASQHRSLWHPTVTLSGAASEAAESKGPLGPDGVAFLIVDSELRGILRLATLAQNDKPTVTLSGAASEAAESKGPPRVGGRHRSSLHPHGSSDQCQSQFAAMSLHSGFIDSISSIFLLLFQPLICFSRAMADRMSLVVSK